MFIEKQPHFPGDNEIKTMHDLFLNMLSESLSLSMVSLLSLRHSVPAVTTTNCCYNTCNKSGMEGVRLCPNQFIQGNLKLVILINTLIPNSSQNLRYMNCSNFKYVTCIKIAQQDNRKKWMGEFILHNGSPSAGTVLTTELFLTVSLAIDHFCWSGNVFFSWWLTRSYEIQQQFIHNLIFWCIHNWR